MLRIIMLSVFIFILKLSAQNETVNISEALSGYESIKSTVETAVTSEVKLTDDNINFVKLAKMVEQADWLMKEAYNRPNEAKKCFEKAIRIYETVLLVTPEDHYVNYKLGSCYFDASVKKDQAIPLLEKAVSLDAGKAIYWNNLGYMYAETGNNEKAIECYLKTIELDPEIRQTYMNIGVCYLKTGKPDKAKEYLLKFDSMTTDRVEKQNVKSILDNIDEYIGN